MKYLSFILVTLLFHTANIKAQNKNQFVIITIEKQSNKGLHKKEINYWIISVKSWINSDNKSLSPIYLTGFSATDYKECTINKNLILYNVTVNESYDFKEGVLKGHDYLLKLIKQNRKKVQTVKKNWGSGSKESIKIYLTPIKGDFCYCNVTHRNEGIDLGYK